MGCLVKRVARSGWEQRPSREVCSNFALKGLFSSWAVPGSCQVRSIAECAFLHNMLALLYIRAGWQGGATTFSGRMVACTISTGRGSFAIACKVAKVLTVVALEETRPVLLCTEKLTLVCNLMGKEIIGSFSCVKSDDKCGMCLLCLFLGSMPG